MCLSTCLSVYAPGNTLLETQEAVQRCLAGIPPNTSELHPLPLWDTPGPLNIHGSVFYPEVK